MASYLFAAGFLIVPPKLPPASSVRATDILPPDQKQQLNALANLIRLHCGVFVEYASFDGLHIATPSIGFGGYGVVFRATTRLSTISSTSPQGSAVAFNLAVKQLKCEDVTPEEVAAFRKEIQLLRDLQHENIIRIFGTCANPPSLLCELMQTNLKTFVTTNPDLSPLARRAIAAQITAGVEYLHHKEESKEAPKPVIIHRDLKPENILLSGGGQRVKLCDFGLARALQTSVRASTSIGTPGYMAPEVVRKETSIWAPGYGTPADIFSLGLVFFFRVCLLLSVSFYLSPA